MRGLTLVIGNRNYSSWSMRPWLAMRHFGSAADAMFVPVVCRFQTHSVDLDTVEAGYAVTILALPAVGKWLKAARSEPWKIERFDEVE